MMKMQGKTYFYVNNVVKCSMKSSLKKEGYFYHQQLFLHQDYLFLYQDYRNFTRCENRSKKIFDHEFSEEVER